MVGEILKYLPVATNTFALVVAGWIYRAYFKSLKASSKAKDEQIKAVEKNIAFWKDKAQDLEKRTPEHMEEILSKRIKIREEEIKRLEEDREGHQNKLQIEELLKLKSNLEKTRDVRKGIDLMAIGLDEYGTINDSDFEIEEIGFVSVDSGQLMITDPCYINGEWQEEQFVTKRHDIKRDFNYSYAGACYASGSKDGYGQLNFKLGHKGAGIAIKTFWGDGDYPVFAEKHNNGIVRVYVNLVESQ